MMINVCVGLGWAQQAPPSTLSNHSGHAGTRTTFKSSYALRPVAIGISMSVETQEEIEETNKSELTV